MTGGIAKAVEEGAEKVGRAAGQDFAKAYQDLLHDTGTKLTKVATSHSENETEIADGFGKVLSGGDKAETEASHISKTLDQGPEYLSRQDEDFAATSNPSGLRKSHYDPDKGMVPANPDGDTTPTQHVLGGRNKVAKENSPFTSFAPEGGDGKVYGPQEMRLDHQRLQQDVDAGKVHGVEVLSPGKVQASIQGDIDGIAGKHVDVGLPHDATPDDVKKFSSSLGLSNKKAAQLQSRVQALLNTQRDQEWLVKGTIPPHYLSGPFPTA